jgi:hypothetical protein
VNVPKLSAQDIRDPLAIYAARIMSANLQSGLSASLRTSYGFIVQTIFLFVDSRLKFKFRPQI